MKKIVSLVLLTAMLLTLALSLTACSAYGGIEKNFTAADWKVVDTTDEDGKNALSFATALGKDENGNVSATVHILKKNALTYAVILEFNADKDAQAKIDEYLTKDETKTYMAYSDKASLVNANCVLIPVCLNLLNAKADAQEMVELFNK